MTDDHAAPQGGARRAAMRRALAVLLLASTRLALAGDALRFGIEAAYPPFAQVATDGTLRGFDIDLARAVCEFLQRECVFVQVEFDGLIPALIARKCDAVIAAMSITAERQRAVDFSDPYFKSAARLVARVEPALEVSPQGLRGKRIGVQRGSIHDRFASSMFTGSEIVRYGRQDEAFLDLAGGRIDATIADVVAAEQGFLKTPSGKGFAFAGPAWSDPAFFGVGAGIALRKGDETLRAGVNQALRGLRASGAYRRIHGRYFDFDDPDAPAAPKAPA